MATELPEKIEQVAYCELTAEQKEGLRGTREAPRAGTSPNLPASKGPEQSAHAHAHRAAAAAPGLLRSASARAGTADAKPQPSGKIELLRELLAEVVDGGHRVLIFSQFVSMLTCCARRSEREIPFCYLDGSTKDRAAEVDRFQNGEVPAFLISLKAGGVGLNLTAADTVIHFDPWWNPAVESQATDRAHRIGQQKVVTAYKLIARDTVEEKILALQQKKRALVDATIESEQPLMEGLSTARSRRCCRKNCGKINRIVTIEQALEFALQHHRGGRLAEAEKIYRQILAADPGPCPLTATARCHCAPGRAA